MDVRIKAAVAAGLEGVNKAALARELGISRSQLYVVLGRFRDGGVEGLEDRSRRPLSSPNQTSVEMEELIVRFRKELLDEGLDAGPRSIRAWMVLRDVADPPHPSTIWRRLDERGLIDKNPKKRPNPVWRRFEADRPNESWQSDATHALLHDGTVVEIINVLDDHSRVNIASVAVTVTDATAVWATLQAAIACWGPPQRVQSDNGQAFTARSVTDNLAALGIGRALSRPYHPQTNGKVERFHLTQREWLSGRRADTLAELQTLLDEHLDLYNNRRPHSACKDKPPIRKFEATAKAVPTGLGIATTNVKTTTNRANATGTVSAGRYSIGLGTPWAGATVTVIIQGLHAAVFHDNELVRQLVIDPDRTYQPTGKKQTGPRPQPRRT